MDKQSEMRGWVKGSFLEETKYELLSIFVDKPLGFFENVRRLFSWIPVVWKIRDYDYGYLFNVMEFQLHNMEKCMRNNAYHVNSDKTGDSLKKARLLLKRINSDDYLENALIPVDKRYGKYDFVITNCGINQKFERDLTKREKIEFEKAFRRAGKHSNKMLEQDEELFFKHIKKHYKKWWD